MDEDQLLETEPAAAGAHVGIARVATALCGIALLVAGRFLGGYGGAVVVGAGIGAVLLSFGRRRPHVLRRRGRSDADGEVDAW